jgi:energy-converting hydrogenase Eha subunit C
MTIPNTKLHQFVWVSATLVTCVSGILLIYWPAIRTGFGVISTDIYDGKIMIAMLEHWHNVYQLKEHPLNPIYFYPFKGVLAYNDANFISGTVYTIFRALGSDAFLAYELTNWTVRVIGAVSTIILARSILGLGTLNSLASGFLSLIVTNLALRMSHSQLLFAAFFPLGLLLFSVTFDRLARLDGEAKPGSAVLAIVGFATFITLWALTAFYSLYIFCLFLIIYFLTLNVLDVKVRTISRNILVSHLGHVVLALAALGIGAAIVLAIYYPALRHGHGVQSIRFFASHPFDLLNVGNGNALWGSFLAPIYQNFTGTAPTSGNANGFTPTLLLTFVASSVWLIQNVRETRSPPAAQGLAMMTACVFVAFLSLKIGDRAMWEPLFNYVPGAKALRVPLRFTLFIAPIVIVVAMTGLNRAPAPLAAVLLLLIAFEQLRVDLPFNLNRTTELEFLQKIPRPPAHCRSFYISVPRYPPTGNSSIDAFYSHSVDAMLIAELRKIPTLNGMTTFTPEGWDLHNPYAPDYRTRVLAYVERMGIRKGLCSLDLQSGAWASA